MMNITPKAYRIWKRLFEDPNKWLMMKDIAFDVNMTCRQVSSVVQTMNSPYIIRDEENDAWPAIMLKVPEKDLDALKFDVISSYNKLDDEMFNAIRSTLSPVGWTTAQDLSAITGYTGAKLSLALSLMDDVIAKDGGKTKMYMLGEL